VSPPMWERRLDRLGDLLGRARRSELEAVRDDLRGEPELFVDNGPESRIAGATAFRAATHLAGL